MLSQILANITSGNGLEPNIIWCPFYEKIWIDFDPSMDK